MNNILRKLSKISTYLIYLLPIFKKKLSSEKYWTTRYKKNGNSGPGSYDKLADFKASIINKIVIEKEISSVIEYGCGDGNQLTLAKYPKYIGFDVSIEALSLCRNNFGDDKTKQFILMADYDNEMAELCMSLDVIYHLLEDDIFEDHMQRLFNSSRKYVVIYSSNTDKQKTIQLPHVKHRNFASWVNQVKPDWTMLEHIPNIHPLTNENKNGSFADFYIYKKN